MSKERDLLVSCLDEFQYHEVPCSDLIRAIRWVLAEPEEEGVYQKLLRIEKENYVEMLPSELWLDGYEAGKRSALLSKQPEQEPVTDKPTETAMAVMPNGVCVSNVYDAYEEGRKSVMVEQEPVAWMWEEEGDEGCVETIIDINKPRVNMYRENIRPLYIAPPVKSEHIEDKLAMFAPVGYLYKQMDCYGEWATIFKVDKPYITWHDIKDIVPLYTSPKKREPLSDEEIDKGYQESDRNYYDLAFRDGVRFAEKAHGIGGGE